MTHPNADEEPRKRATNRYQLCVAQRLCVIPAIKVAKIHSYVACLNQHPPHHDGQGHPQLPQSFEGRYAESYLRQLCDPAAYISWTLLRELGLVLQL